MTDARWDLKFLGMQIMIEGLALGAFGFLRSQTSEPLLKQLLTYVITDEARHVHYGVLALQKFFAGELSAKERREREDWAFEVAYLLRTASSRTNTTRSTGRTRCAARSGTSSCSRAR